MTDQTGGDNLRTRPAVHPRPAAIALKWMIASVLSFVLIWCVTLPTLDREPELIYNATLDEYVVPAGEVCLYRSEGRGTTTHGAFGSIGVMDPRKAEKPAVVFWGDSYVEAYHVDDSAKMHMRFTELAKRSGKLDAMGLAVGQSGWSFANYVRLMPVYEQLTPDVLGHVFVIGQRDDIFPEGRSKNRYFSMSPEPGFYETDVAPKGQNVKAALHNVGMDFMWQLIRRASTAQLRFAPTTASLPETAQSSPSVPPEAEDAWRFLCTQIRDHTQKKVVFVYLPQTPMIADGGVTADNPDIQTFRAFSRVCSEYGIDFVDMSPAFLALYAQQGRFARGFRNSRLSRGHLNIDGHTLVAEAVLAIFEDR